MNHMYWRKQAADKPLFPDILWSRPESKAGAGKLAIIGGNAFAFGAPGIAWNEANDSMVGICHVLLPDAIKKTVAQLLPEAEFAPSNPSGSFSKKALDDLLRLSQWSDCAMLAGDLGRNSETAILLESYLAKYTGLLAITQDAADYFKEMPLLALDRPQTLVTVSLAQLQRMFIATPFIKPITYGMSTPQLVETLHEYTAKYQACIITKHNDLIFVAQNGQVVTQKHEDKVWRIKTTARSAVFWLQNPSKQFEAIVSSLAITPDETV